MKHLPSPLGVMMFGVLGVGCTSPDEAPSTLEAPSSNTSATGSGSPSNSITATTVEPKDSPPLMGTAGAPHSGTGVGSNASGGSSSSSDGLSTGPARPTGTSTATSSDSGPLSGVGGTSEPTAAPAVSSSTSSATGGGAGGDDSGGAGASNTADAGSSNAGAGANSCNEGGPGRSDCGANGNESCCESLVVEGGTYFRSYQNTGNGPTGEGDAATISSYRLDKYEVTVGRFRKFVEYLAAGGSPPAEGSGKHTHLNGGQGLADSGKSGAFEEGWDEGWNDRIPNGPGAAEEWKSLVASGINGNKGCGIYGTWTDEAGDNETRPITCTSWYESYAFCIWDGGFLPSEAEWKYAAAGGDEQRMYPWGTDPIGTSNEYIIYDCCYPDEQCNAQAGRDTCTGVGNVPPVGFASKGVGRYGQYDLVGSVWEWLVDRYVDGYANPCEDCAMLSANTQNRVLPGSGFHTGPSLGGTLLYSWNRASVSWNADTYRGDYAAGVRCGRAP